MKSISTQQSISASVSWSVSVDLCDVHVHFLPHLSLYPISALSLTLSLSSMWSDLPKPPLHSILRHVPQRQRLGHTSSCALVCISWAEAAAAATDSIVLEECADAISLQLWLQQHGSSITQLHLHGARGQLLELPCPQLADLLLHGRTLLSTPYLVDMLTALPSLQRLTLHTGCEAFHLPSNLLQQLPGLTHLGVQFHRQPLGYVRVLQGLSSLTNCSHLDLEATGWLSFPLGLDGLQDLPQLTFLKLSGLGCWAEAPPSLPSLSMLTALQHLQTAGWDFQSSQLAGMTSLQHLCLIWRDVSDADRPAAHPAAPHLP